MQNKERILDFFSCPSCLKRRRNGDQWTSTLQESQRHLLTVGWWEKMHIYFAHMYITKWKQSLGTLPVPSLILLCMHVYCIFSKVLAHSVHIPGGPKKNGMAYFWYPDAKTNHSMWLNIFLEEEWHQDCLIWLSIFHSRDIFVDQCKITNFAIFPT